MEMIINRTPTTDLNVDLKLQILCFSSTFTIYNERLLYLNNILMPSSQVHLSMRPDPAVSGRPR